MSQFKIFRNFRRVFFFVGYLPEERILDGKYGHAVTSFLFICTLFACELTSIAYVVHHWKIGDYKNSLFACLQVAAIIPSIASFCTIMYHRDQLREVIDQFQRIFDECNESHLKNCFSHFYRWICSSNESVSSSLRTVRSIFREVLENSTDRSARRLHRFFNDGRRNDFHVLLQTRWTHWIQTYLLATENEVRVIHSVSVIETHANILLSVRRSTRTPYLDGHPYFACNWFLAQFTRWAIFQLRPFSWPLGCTSAPALINFDVILRAWAIFVPKNGYTKSGRTWS